jgi:TPR repeat protein
MIRIVAALAVVLATAPSASAQTQPVAGTRVKTITIPVTPAPEDATPATLPVAASESDLAFGAFQRGRYLEAAARAEKIASNDPRALTLLGELYGEGLGVPRDLKRSFGYYQRAHERGDNAATFAVAMGYLQGIGVAQNREQAAKLLRIAADKGHAAAAYNLSLLYLQGQVLKPDFAEAARLMRIAAEKDIADAQHALAIFHQEGKGVAKDERESVRWLRRAAKLDHVPATIELAIALFNGRGTEKDEKAAAQAMRRAALKGNPLAQNRLARMMSAGRGVEKNVVEAMAWHLMARSQNVSDPMLDDIFGDMNPDDKKKAQDILRAWLLSKAPPA